MGNARARGSYEQRKADAIKAGRIRIVKPHQPLPSALELFAGFMASLARKRKAKVEPTTEPETK